MTPKADIQRNLDTQKRLEGSFKRDKIYLEIALSNMKETLIEGTIIIFGLAAALIVLLCAAGVGIGLMRIILRHFN